MAFISMLFAFGAIFFIVCLLMLVAGAACVVFCALLGIQYQESARAAAANGGTGKKTWKLTECWRERNGSSVLGSLFWMNVSTMMSVDLML